MEWLSLIILKSLALIVTSQNECGDNKNTIILQQITEPVLHAEGPHWDEEEQVLYYVDIAGFSIHRYDPLNGQHTSLTLNDTVGVVVPVQDQKHNFIVGLGRKIVQVTWDGNSTDYKLKIIFEVDKDKPGNRFNDGKADINGNLWIGTMGKEEPVGVVQMNQGSLFRMNRNRTVDKVISPVSISNGIAWRSDNQVMYYIDSPTRRVDVFDYNGIDTEISNRRPFFDFAKNGLTGVPDGMTIDSDDNLWVACWGGGKVIQISGETGKLMRSVDIPAERVTSVAFGGDDLATLYVTTMRVGLTAKQLISQPTAGSVFAITGLEVHGVIADKVDITFEV